VRSLVVRENAEGRRDDRISAAAIAVDRADSVKWVSGK
jgi:hypothetical protein